MSVSEHLQDLIGKYQYYQEIIRSPIIHQNSINEDDIVLKYQKINKSKQQIGSLISETISELECFKEEYDGLRSKLAESQHANDNKNIEIHNIKYQISKLNSDIIALEEREEHLKAELLHGSIVNQRKQDEWNGLVAHLKEEQSENKRYLEDITLRFNNLQNIYQSQTKKRQQLQDKLQTYKNNQISLERHIVKLNSEYIQLNNKMQNIIKEKDDQINQLEQFISENMQNEKECEQELNFYGQHEWHDDQCQEFLKQVSIQENVYTDLSSLKQIPENSFYQLSSPNTERKNVQKQFNSESYFDKAESYIRRRSSSTKLIPTSVSLETNPIQSSKQQNRQNINETRLPHTDRSRLSFTNMIDITIQKQTVGNISNTNDEAQTMLTSRNMYKKDLSITSPINLYNVDTKQNENDPYFIHYLLTVQYIKIEEDQDGLYGILDIQMKEYYEQLIKQKIPMVQWSNWIRQKLLSIHQTQREREIM